MNRLLYLMPLFPSLLTTFMVIPGDGEMLLSYMLFLVLTLNWWGFLTYVFKIPLSAHPFAVQNQDEYRSSLYILLPLLICFFALMAIFRRVVTSDIFLLALILFVLQGAIFRLFPHRPLLFRAPTLFFSFVISAAISYFLLLRSYHWPVIPLSAGAASLPFGPWFANLLRDWSELLPEDIEKRANKRKAYRVQKDFPVKTISRVYSVSLGVFPAVLLVLCAMRQLPPRFLLACLPILLTSQLLSETRQLEASRTLSNRFLKLNMLYPYLYLVLLIGLSVL